MPRVGWVIGDMHALGRHRIRRVHDRDQGNEHYKHQVDEGRQRQPIASQPPPGIRPEADLLPGERFLELLRGCRGGDRHQYRILGSSTVYRRSTPRLAMPTRPANIVKTPITML